MDWHSLALRHFRERYPGARHVKVTSVEIDDGHAVLSVSGVVSGPGGSVRLVCGDDAPSDGPWKAYDCAGDIWGLTYPTDGVFGDESS